MSEPLGYVCMCGECGWLSEAYVEEDEAAEANEGPCPDCGSPGVYVTGFD